MARNALEAVFGALGGGLVGYGKDKKRRYDEGQDTADREEERLARELAARQSAEQRQISLFQSGLEEAAPLRERAAKMGTASSAVGALAGMPPVVGGPVGMSAMARALAGASSGMHSDLSRGRNLSVGGKDYVQPFSRTPEGRAEAERRQAESDARVDAMNQKNRDAALAAQSLREIKETGNQNRLRDAERPLAAGERPGGRGRVGVDMPALPTVVRAADEVAALTREQVLGMDPSRVWAASMAPLLAAEPTATSIALSGGMNLWANKGGILTGSKSTLEPLYAQYIAGVSDAVARIGERVGVMTNQDIARYRALTTFLPGDSDDIKLRKWENLRDWAKFLVDARRVAENPSEQALAQLRERVATLGAGANDESVKQFERTAFNLWADKNERLDANESPAEYLARFTRDTGIGGR